MRTFVRECRIDFTDYPHLSPEKVTEPGYYQFTLILNQAQAAFTTFAAGGDRCTWAKDHAGFVPARLARSPHPPSLPRFPHWSAIAGFG
jgi:hypothetical protein